jgi:hypothetical protein
MSTPHTKFAFLTIDGVEQRLDAATLKWLAINPIKNSAGLFLIDYIHGDNPQREHTVSMATAAGIYDFILFATGFDRTKGGGFDTGCEFNATSSNVRGQQAATARIDVALEQVILLARECGKSEEFASDIATPLKLLLRLMIRDAMVEQSRENRDALRKFTDVSLGKPYGTSLPVEDAPRDGEKPYGYMIGHLSKEALACLEDVVSHAADFRSALSARRMVGIREDRESAEQGEPPVEPGGEESYWVKQQQVFERMVMQARTALDIHAKVSK